MSYKIVTNIGVKTDPTPVMKRLHITEEDDDYARLMELIHEAGNIANPKALYKISYIDERGEDYIVTEGVKLSSRVLGTNLKDVHRFFPYVVTCGTELDEWSKSLNDIVEQYWSDCIKEYYLGQALAYMENRIKAEQNLNKVARMNPGSLKDWPLSQQQQLFAILGDTYGMIGVKLTESALMLPTKSVSGIFFHTETSYENCRLCPRENCPNRRTAYSKELEEKYTNS